MILKTIRGLSESIRRFEPQAREYERKTAGSMAACFSLVFLFYGLLFLPLEALGYTTRESLILSLAGMGLLVVLSLGFAWMLRYRFPLARLPKIGWWCFGYYTLLLFTLFLMWALGTGVSVTPLFIIIISLSFTWLHVRQLLIYISVTLLLMLVSFSLVEFNYFWFLEFMVLYLFAVSLHLLHVRQQCRFFEYQHLIELDRNADGLTGLLNRRALEEAFPRFRADCRSIAAILVDIDHFKTVNDTLGHAAGDQALMEAAGIFRSLFRKEDFTVRLGGDEFLILLGLERQEEEVLTRKLRALLDRTPIALTGPSGTVPMTFSVGAYLCRAESARSLEQLIACADGAMYRIKQDGRNGALITAEDGPEIRLKGPDASCR